MKTVCVFASGSTKLASVYTDEAERLGRLIAQNGMGLIFGGGRDGLMGAVARGAAYAGGTVTGVVPDIMDVDGLLFEGCAELLVTKTLRERKAAMEERADAFIALPGGFGTLEELLEIITLRHLGYHRKPIAIISTNGFYDCLAAQLEQTVRQGFAAREASGVYRFCANAQEALAYIQSEEALRPYKKNELMKEHKQR